MRAGGEAGTAPGSLATAVNGDALQLPFADSTFDRIIASEVLEHVSDDQQSLHEVFRVLKPGGTLAATVPSWLPEKICWALSDEYHAPFVEGGHVRIYKERSEEHTSELQSLMRISYAVFCLTKKTISHTALKNTRQDKLF